MSENAAFLLAAAIMAMPGWYVDAVSCNIPGHVGTWEILAYNDGHAMYVDSARQWFEHIQQLQLQGQPKGA